MPPARCLRRRCLTWVPVPDDDPKATAGPVLASDFDTAVALLKEALFLRMNGEHAPGGGENWHDWDSRAEVFLRGLLPPEEEPPQVRSSENPRA